MLGGWRDFLKHGVPAIIGWELMDWLWDHVTIGWSW